LTETGEIRSGGEGFVLLEMGILSLCKSGSVKIGLFSIWVLMKIAVFTVEFASF
jgi:hypothetical protein